MFNRCNSKVSAEQLNHHLLTAHPFSYHAKELLRVSTANIYMVLASILLLQYNEMLYWHQSPIVPQNPCIRAGVYVPVVSTSPYRAGRVL